MYNCGTRKKYIYATTHLCKTVIHKMRNKSFIFIYTNYNYHIEFPAKRNLNFENIFRAFQAHGVANFDIHT